MAMTLPSVAIEEMRKVGAVQIPVLPSKLVVPPKYPTNALLVWNSWLPLTASRLPASTRPSARLVRATAAPLASPARVMVLVALPLTSASYFTASRSTVSVWSATLASEVLTASKALPTLS
ncbi:hypothetical protein D3C71_1282870 [compost metagenome]